MLATLVRAQLLAELALYAALGLWLHREQGWSLAQLIIAALATALVARLAIVAFSTSISWWVRSPRTPDQQLGAIGTARLVIGEWKAMLADNFWFLPFEAWAVRQDAALAPATHPPVLLVHGYLSNRGIFHALVAALDAAGVRPLVTFNFRGPFAPIDALVGQLEAQVTRVIDAAGAPRVVLVCHSMGGLVARAWLARHGASRLARLVTIASPHHGTALSRLGLGANAAQMRVGCEFLAQLQRGEGESGPGVPVTSLYTVHDNLVAPQAGSRLAFAKNLALSGVGHVAILNDPALHRAVIAELREAGAA